MTRRAPLVRAQFDGEIVLPREAGRFVPGYRYSPETMFAPGERMSAETEFRPGERRSQATEFKPGVVAHNRLPVGAETIRTNHRNGERRAWVKVAEPNRWRRRAVIVWERVNGPLPRGMVIHHVDHDTLNDELGNLEALTRAEHVAEHRSEVYAWRRSA